jgi:hypothetical protein
MDRASLKDRTIRRGEAVWQDYDLDNLTEGSRVARVEGQIDQLGRDTIRQGIAIVDGEVDFQAEQRGRLHELELMGVEQDQRLAYEKNQREQQVLAMKIAGEQAILASKEYDAVVQAYIMTAKEFAAKVEREQIALQRTRALMDIKKEEAHLKTTESQILLEYINRVNVQVDIAKAKLEAAQAVVKAIMTEFEAKQYDLRVVQADLEIVMAEVERATLLADIAMIFADIIVRGLAKIKFEVDSAEIEAGFRYIQSKLDDMLAIWSDRKSLEEVREAYELLFKGEILKQLPLQEAGEDLKLEQQDREVETFFFEKDKIDGSGAGGRNLIQEMRPGGVSEDDWDALMSALYKKTYNEAGELVVTPRHYTGQGTPIAQCEKLKKDAQQKLRELLVEIKFYGEQGIRKSQAYAEKLVSAAHAAVLGFTEIVEVEHRLFSQRIHKGFFSVAAPKAGTPQPPAQPPPADLPDRDIEEGMC